MKNNIIWMDGGFLFEINKQYKDLGQEAVLTNQMCIIKLYQDYIILLDEKKTSKHVKHNYRKLLKEISLHYFH